MQIVVVKSPKMLGGILRLIFGIKDGCIDGKSCTWQGIFAFIELHETYLIVISNVYNTNIVAGQICPQYCFIIFV